MLVTKVFVDTHAPFVTCAMSMSIGETPGIAPMLLTGVAKSVYDDEPTWTLYNNYFVNVRGQDNFVDGFITDALAGGRVTWIHKRANLLAHPVCIAEGCWGLLSAVCRHLQSASSHTHEGHLATQCTHISAHCSCCIVHPALCAAGTAPLTTDDRRSESAEKGMQNLLQTVYLMHELDEAIAKINSTTPNTDALDGGCRAMHCGWTIGVADRCRLTI